MTFEFLTRNRHFAIDLCTGIITDRIGKDNTMRRSSSVIEPRKGNTGFAKIGRRETNRFIIMVALSILFFRPGTGYPEDSPTFEERLSRMEQEIRLLQDRNASLVREVEELRMQLDSGAGADLAKEMQEPESQFEVAYKKGLIVASPDNEFKMKMGGRVTTRFTALDSGHPSSNEFAVERARLYTNVTLLDHYDLRIQTELSKDAELKDGYLNIHHVPWAELKIGQFKPPYTWENLQSHKYIDFSDRSIAVNNMRGPSRDAWEFRARWATRTKTFQVRPLKQSAEPHLSISPTTRFTRATGFA